MPSAQWGAALFVFVGQRSGSPSGVMAKPGRCATAMYARKDVLPSGAVGRLAAVSAPSSRTSGRDSPTRASRSPASVPYSWSRWRHLAVDAGAGCWQRRCGAPSAGRWSAPVWRLPVLRLSGGYPAHAGQPGAGRRLPRSVGRCPRWIGSKVPPKCRAPSGSRIVAGGVVFGIAAGRRASVPSCSFAGREHFAVADIEAGRSASARGQEISGSVKRVVTTLAATSSTDTSNRSAMPGSGRQTAGSRRWR